jgi:large subunit ribosomal protein L19e
MGVSAVRKMAAGILKCGESRVKIQLSKEVEEALTREDVKSLIRAGLVWKVQKKGTSKFRSRVIKRQKRKGRRIREGSRKGKFGAKNPKKKIWIKGIRALRRLLKGLRENGQIGSKTYTQFYPRIKGGEFRNKKHLLFYLKEHDLLKSRKELGKEPEKAAKKKVSRKAAKKSKPKESVKHEKDEDKGSAPQEKKAKKD